MKNIIVVDLDGTLIRTDMLYETALSVLKCNPFYVLLFLWWLLRGKANLKKELAIRSKVDISALPFNNELIEWLRHEKKSGARMVLATASDQRVANSVSQFLEIFDDVIASDGDRNVAGLSKLELLVQRYGDHNFDYAGNSNVDLTIWAQAKNAILVNCSSSVIERAHKVCGVRHIFQKKSSLFDVLRIFRFHQWAKNILLFIPLIAAHQWQTLPLLQADLIAFLAFGFTASSVYIMNDMIDLDNDRYHPRKKNRPFASGDVSLLIGCVFVPILLLLSIWLGYRVSMNFLVWLGIYFAITCAYTLFLKKIVLIDCLTLAILYSLRLIAGGSASSINISFWLLSFSVFFFFSLAFVKRYSELQTLHLAGKDKVVGRGYHTSDISLIQMIGVSTGFASVLVFSLYINSQTISELYRNPEIIWLLLPLLMYWVAYAWLKAHRGEMHDDPIVFAIKDRISLMIAFLFIIIFTVAIG